MIASQVVEVLVRAGRHPGLDIDRIPPEMESIRGEDEINRLGWRDWDGITAILQVEDLVALAKALTICEERFRWAGGSVAAVIWVYREIERRNKPLAHQVADWVLARTSNPWAPFGSINLGARSLAQYREKVAANETAKVVKARHESERAEAGKVKRERRREEAVRRQDEQAQATAARRAWTVEWASLPVAEQLQRIATDHTHPIDYYPMNWAQFDVGIVQSLAPEVRKKLADRLRDRRKGPWKRILCELQGASGGASSGKASDMTQPNPRFAKGGNVQRINQPDAVGVVRDLRWDDQAEGWNYSVQFGAQLKVVPEEGLREFILIEGPWDAFGSQTFSGHEHFCFILTYHRLRRPPARIAHSFTSSRTLFFPHQFKALLKFLDHPGKRILIADDVGLGKTIEAGYILRELEAHEDVERVLVLVPSRLTRKWKKELKDRFEEHFDIVPGRRLIELADRLRSGSEPEPFRWIVSYEAARHPDVRIALEETQPAIDVLIAVHLYVILDIFSRYVVGWLLAEHENAGLAKRLISESSQKQGVQPGQLTLHADRGAAMKAKTTAQLLADLSIVDSHSRPRVSNDNPYSESHFRTLKYRPEFPERFASYKHAHTVCRELLTWYNTEHCHSGISYLTPETVHYGRAAQALQQRQQVLDQAHALNPDRFIRAAPRVQQLPPAVWINPPKKEEQSLIHTQ